MDTNTKRDASPPKENDVPAPTSHHDDSDELKSLLANNEKSESQHVQSPITFHVTKFVILRLVGFVYLIAFVGAYNQNRGLMGKNGLMPAHTFLDRLRRQYASPIKGFVSHPTLFWFLPSSTLEDWHMECIAALGATFSLAVVMGLNSWVIMAALWLLDFSIVTVAQGATEFYSYGWECQLLETGFLFI